VEIALVRVRVAASQLEIAAAIYPSTVIDMYGPSRKLRGMPQESKKAAGIRAGCLGNVKDAMEG
jgi:hypothetical protein